MRDLSGTLEAAQQSASGRPYVAAVLTDHDGDRPSPTFTRHYTGGETDYTSALVGAGDGSLVRAWIDPGTDTLYTKRVATPGPSSDFSSSPTSHGVVGTSRGVALCALGAAVRLFYVAAGGVDLKVKDSADYGATWSAAANVTTLGGTKARLAAAYGASASECLVIWAEGATVYRSRHNGSSWGTRTAWSNSVADASGLAVAFLLDFQVIVTGAELTTDDPKVWSCVFGNGVLQTLDTWSALHEITTAAAASLVTFSAPAVSALGSWWLFFVEAYGGSVAYDRVQWSTTEFSDNFIQEKWREPAAFDLASEYGVSCAATNLGGYVWLNAPNGVWRGAVNAELDVTEDVLEAHVELGEADGRARLVLRNDSASNAALGRYAGYGAGDALAVLQRGARLQLQAGYYTPEGPELPSSGAAAYWVESVELVTGDHARIVIEARDGWWLLDRWRARRTFQWAAGVKAVSQLVGFVASRAGLEFGTFSSSAAFTTLKPAFTIHPGESGKTALRRLLAMVPDVAYFEGGVLMTRNPQAVDASQYAYGAGHALVSGRYRDLGAKVNRARVVGTGVYDERFDFAEANAMGERLAQVLDENITTAGQAGDRAAAVLREAEIGERGDEIVVSGVNCGQQLWDVVSVTDAQAGLAAVKRRVRELSWRYETGRRPRYDMTLVLGSA